MNVVNDLSGEALRARVMQHLTYTLGKDKSHASLYDWRMAVSYSVRDILIEPWFEATRKTYEAQGKRVYYLSMEFLIGRILEDAMVNLGLRDTMHDMLEAEGIALADVIEDEPDAALGNGGLGRLAACFLESMSTLACPPMGIRTPRSPLHNPLQRPPRWRVMAPV